MGGRLLRSVLGTVLVLGASVGVVAGTARPAAALCTSSPLQGNWRNVNTTTPAMARVVVETCQPVTTCSGNVCTTQHDAGTFMTPYGRCSPTDCNWGRRQAQHMGSGWIRTVHDFGFKTSSVWAKTYEYYGRTYLRLWVYNDFTPADGRADYTTDEWFLP